MHGSQDSMTTDIHSEDKYSGWIQGRKDPRTLPNEDSIFAIQEHREMNSRFSH